MGDIGQTLPSYFGLGGTKTVKERGGWLCQSTPPVKIYKTSEAPGEISARYALLAALAAAGFSHTDHIIESSQGTPYVNLGRDTYVMTRHIPGREMNLDDAGDVALALQTLARFHIAAQGACASPQKGREQGTPGKFGLSPAPPLTETYEKQSAALEQAVKQASRRPRLSDIDVLLLKHADTYTDQAQRAAQALKATSYTALHAKALAGGHIIHGAVKEENFPFYGGDCYIVNFADAAIDLQLTDLEAFIRRYARRSRREIPPGRFLEIYGEASPLPACAPEILRAALLFPWPFMKIVHQYYSKKRAFTPVAIASRMAAVLEEQGQYDEYVSGLR